MCHPVVFYADMMGDFMYLHQALKQDDFAEFIEAVFKKVDDHTEQKLETYWTKQGSRGSHTIAISMSYEMKI